MNNKFFRLLAIALLFFCTFSLNAFSVKRNAYYNKNIFGIEFPNATSFYAAANLVGGVSMQRYILGAFEVSEVVIDINGSPSQLRIYAVNLIGASTAKFKQSQLANIVDAADTYVNIAQENLGKYLPDTDNIVIKEYSNTTHSKTIEYKVALADLDAFYKAFTTDFTKTSTSSATVSDDDDDDDDDSETVTSMSKTSIGGTKYSF